MVHVRRHHSNSVIDRIVVRHGDAWLCIDTSSAGSGLRSVWAVSPSIGVKINTENSSRFILRDNDSSAALAVETLGHDTSVALLNRSESPWGGWYATEGQVVGTTALEVVAGESAWTALGWRMVAGNPNSVDLGLVEFVAVDDWRWYSSAGEKEWAVVRAGERVRIIDAQHGQLETTLLPAPSGRAATALAAFYDSLAKYPPHNDLLPWRNKMFRLAMLAATLQLLALVALWRWLRRRPGPTLCLLVTGIACHVGIGVWLHAVYFAT